jgi:hypothetical protein
LKSQKVKTNIGNGDDVTSPRETRTIESGGDWEKRRIHLIMPKELLDSARSTATKKFQTLTEYAKTSLQTLMLLDKLQSEGMHIFVSKAETLKTPEGDDSPVIEILRDRIK